MQNGIEWVSMVVEGQSFLYGNFDIIWEHFSRVSRLRPTPHARWAVFYLVPRLTPC